MVGHRERLRYSVLISPPIRPSWVEVEKVAAVVISRFGFILYEPLTFPEYLL
jgi:hypothetical protein